MEVPRTLLVTNDYPPRVGGIQRTLEALVRSSRRTAWPSYARTERRFDRRAPYCVLRQPEGFLWPTGEVGARGCAFARTRRRWSCSAPRTRSDISSARARAARDPIPVGGPRLRVLARSRRACMR